MNDAPDLTAGPRGRASAAKHAWSEGATPDALAVLENDPELLADKSAVLDLAYEEFCRRAEAGAAPDPEAFVTRFPAYQASLRRVLLAHLFLMDNGALLEEPAPRWPEAGQRLADWVLVRELGRGAFARVFLATEETTGGRKVALKLSREGGAEARTLGPLSHPNIVPVLSARHDEASGLTAVCMPYLGSATLEDLLERAFPAGGVAAPPQHARLILDVARSAFLEGDGAAADPVLLRGTYAEGVMQLGAQVADALAYLHGQGVCHRDLKPSNVLLGPGGRPLLLDFNLSAEGGGTALHLGGTVPYMAPEQLEAFLARGAAEAPRLDERADLFSLGVILYELLTGRHPFGPVPVSESPRDPARFLLERQRGGHRPLRRAGRGVDRRLARLIEGCLALSPAERPVSARAVAAALRRQLALPARLCRWAGRRPFAAAGLAGALALAVGGMAWAGTLLVPASPRPSVTAPAPELDDYSRGKAALEADRLDEAEECFRRAAQREPDQAHFWLAYGLAQMRQAAAITDRQREPVAADKFAAAAEAFWKAGRYEQSPLFLRLPSLGGIGLAASPQAAGPRLCGSLLTAGSRLDEGPAYACRAYCMTRQRSYKAAIDLSEKAIRAGFAPAEVWNNLAYCCWRRTGQTEEAEPHLETALRLDPELRAARYNRAVFTYFTRHKGPGGAAMRRRLAQALEDIEQGLVTKPAGTQPYLYAAYLYSYAILDLSPDRETKDRYAADALRHLKEAAARGPAAIIQADPLLRAALGKPELAAIGVQAQLYPDALSTPELAEPPVQLR
jgi:tetratricopeptide (TPR) repeat protein